MGKGFCMPKQWILDHSFRILLHNFRRRLLSPFNEILSPLPPKHPLPPPPPPPQGFPMDTGLMGDIDSELQSMDFGEDFPSTQLGVAQGMEDTLPKATGYLISTSPPGQLPDEFFGHDKPQTACSLFKVCITSGLLFSFSPAVSPFPPPPRSFLHKEFVFFWVGGRG